MNQRKYKEIILSWEVFALEESKKETVERLKAVLKRDFNIHNEKEFLEALKNSKGINIGIFTMPLPHLKSKQEVDGK